MNATHSAAITTDMQLPFAICLTPNMKAEDVVAKTDGGYDKK